MALGNLDIAIGYHEKDWIGRKNKPVKVGKMLTFECVEHGKPHSKAMKDILASKDSYLMKDVPNVFQGVQFLSTVEIKNNYQWAILLTIPNYNNVLRLDLDAYSFSVLMQRCTLDNGKLKGTYAFDMLPNDTRKRLVKISD